MNDPLISAYSALEARMKIVDVIANNLANSGTTGFKRDFGHVLQSEEEGFDIRSVLDPAPGDMIATGNELDVAVNGEGYFAIQTPAGIRYTRNGSFIVNEAGDLVTKDGMSVLSDSNSPIAVGKGRVAVQDSGIITLEGNEIASLKLVRFKDLGGLQKEGLHRMNWRGAPEDVIDVEDPKVKGGHLERANVNSVVEMVHLMAAYRDFESVQRAVKVLSSDMNSRLIQEMGKLG